MESIQQEKVDSVQPQQGGKQEECNELKTLKYKTLIMNGHVLSELKSSSCEELHKLDKFLEDDKTQNLLEPWSKLDKTGKIKKLMVYTDKYAAEHGLDETEKAELVVFFRDCMDKKRIQRVKDVVYDKETGTISDIPMLAYNKGSKHFTLKNVEKRVNTLKSLPPPRKKKGTLRNIGAPIQAQQATTGDKKKKTKAKTETDVQSAQEN
jgi:hypothetical protein